MCERYDMILYRVDGGDFVDNYGDLWFIVINNPFWKASARQAAGARTASGQAGGVSNVSSQSGGSSQPIAKQSTSIGVMNASSQPSAAPSTLSQGPTQHRAGPRQGFQAPRPGFPTQRLARRLPADTAQGNCHLSSVIMQ
ncbi:hypothetical protein Tco_1136748 [Tanacetum coccineum]